MIPAGSKLPGWVEILKLNKVQTNKQLKDQTINKC